MGEDPALTPNLDRFAAESLACTDAVSNCPLCSPFRAMLLTGKYPSANGVTDNCSSRPYMASSYLRANERCLSDVLADSGYDLGYIGKWHLEHPEPPFVDPGPEAWDEYTPPERRHGFSFWHSHGIYDNHLAPRYWVGDSPRDRPTTFYQWSPRHEADVAISYIRNEGGRVRDPARPFALFVAMNPPHPPWDMVPGEYVQRYAHLPVRDLLNRPNVDFDSTSGEVISGIGSAHLYFAAVTGVDHQFGRILQCLADEGLAKDTIVVFTSDHGEMLGSHGRMGKMVWYEESLGIPFIIRWPGVIRPRRDDLLLSVPDIMPSLLGLLGLGSRTPQGVQGIDLSETILGGSGPRPSSALYIQAGAEQFGARGVRTHLHTYAYNRSVRAGSSELLFDNVHDPYQMKNLARRDAATAAGLHREMIAWLERIDDPWLKAGT
ncbi:MAG: sulfatase [Candidatus Eisenbacteria bacterium]|nr:sulfatase [Candidatus Eisenbacteria bacterium]